MNQFALALKNLIEITSVSHSYLAQSVSYDPSYVSKWVHGRSLPSKYHINEICNNIADCITLVLDEKMISELIPLLTIDVVSMENINLKISNYLKKAYKECVDKEVSSGKSNNYQLLPTHLKNNIIHKYLEHISTNNTIDFFTVSDVFAMNDKTSYLRILNSFLKNDHGKGNCSCMYSIDHIESDLVKNIQLTFRGLVNCYDSNFDMYYTTEPVYTEISIIRNKVAIINSYLNRSKYLTTQEISDIDQVEKLYLVYKKMFATTGILISEKSTLTFPHFFDFYSNTKFDFLLNNFNELFCLDGIFDNCFQSVSSQTMHLVRCLVQTRKIRIILTKDAISDLCIHNTITCFSVKIKLEREQTKEYINSIIHILKNNNIETRLLLNHLRVKDDITAPVTQYLSDQQSIIFDNYLNGDGKFNVITSSDILAHIKNYYNLFWNNPNNFSTMTNIELIKILEMYI